MSHALVSLSLKVARRSGEDEQIEAKLEQYADDLMQWPEPVALAVLAEHPKRSIYWPAWKELEDLRIELEERQREARALPPPGSSDELFADRATRLKLHRRLAAIGVQRYRVVIDRHLSLSDEGLLAAIGRLERGHAPFDEEDPQAPFTSRRDWSEFCEAMATVRAMPPCPERDTLLAIGTGIEVRQRPNAQQRGWI